MGMRVAIGVSSFAAGDEAPRKLLEEHGLELVPNPFGRRLTEEEIVAHLAEADGLIAGLEPLNRRVLESAPRLKALARVGIGMTNVDAEAAQELGIKVSNTPEGPIQAVAELTLAALLALRRGLLAANAALHAGEWKKSLGRGLIGAPVLVVGYGGIGRRVGGLLRAFGAKVLVADPFIDGASLTRGEQLVSLDEGLGAAEIVTLHASGLQPLIGAPEFDKMRDGALLLNSARGELVDETALIRALESGKLAGAWFDAFWEEPYRGRLCEFEQVLLTPHTATYTRQCRLDMELAAAQNLLRDLGLEG